MTGIFSGHNDLAVWILYAFWIFFAGLIYYLHRENKREGYPLIPDTGGRAKMVVGFPAPPPSKTFHLLDGSSVTVTSDGRPDPRPIAAAPTAPWPGAPLEPTGDPMRDGVGPAAWAERRDTPDLIENGEPRLAPLRAAADFYPAERDPDPRGMEVIGADRRVAGVVRDIWVDKAEFVARYFEVELAGGGARVLLPVPFALVDGRRRVVEVAAILSTQFAGVPGTAHPDRVTLREEDRIAGYYGGGTLYATPDRQEPFL
jgi:photosynthetic reaction center H subunit